MCHHDLQLDKPAANRCFRRLIAFQHGAFSRAQANAHGYTDTMIRDRVQSGSWVALRRGVYRIATSPPVWRQRLVALCLSGGKVTFASHASAAVLWSIDGFEPGPLHVSTTRHLRSCEGAVVHRVLAPPAGDVQALGPFNVASPTRTLLEVASSCEPEQLEIALDDVMRRRLSSVARVQWRLNQVGAKGRAGAAILRKLITERQGDGLLPESALERRFLRLLEAQHLPPPARQHEIHDESGFIARVDFAYPATKLAVEVDGFRYHSGRAHWEHDRRRRNRLEAEGWRVLHVTSEQIRARPAAILEPLRKLLTPRLIDGRDG